ncbi:hypothetical protein [Endozoicomonas sp.]|uniref:hypothetical protein n=1 Tax=Endozoicomonas sp. TaxID=1892382 RepID=UPI002884DA79|nr:hypothetical protein [Endozoicomonas sp.]
MPPHRDSNPAPRFRSDEPFNYTEQLLSYLASLYLDGVLTETDNGDGCVWALIRVFDENDKESLSKHYTYRGEIGFLIDDGIIFSEVLVNAIEEII